MKNRNLIYTFFIFISIFFLTSNLSAEDNKNGFYWWRVPEVVSEIGLSSKQVDTIESVFQTHKEKIGETDKKINEKENELKTLLNDPASENSEVKLLGKEVLKLKSERKALKLDMLFGIRDVLTVEQRKMLKELKNKHR